MQAPGPDGAAPTSGAAATAQRLGTRLREWREAKGWSPAELARRAGVARSFVVKIEAGLAARPSGDVLARLAKALGTTPNDLLGQVPDAPAEGLSPSLVAFARDVDLPVDDLEMLARIRYRGEQPATVDDWRFVYEAIRRSIRPRGER